MTDLIRVSLLAAAMAAVALGDRAVSPRLPTLQITTDRLSYRLTRENDYYVVRLIVTLRNPTPDTVFLTGECGIQDLPFREFVPVSGEDLFMPPMRACALSSRSVAPRIYGMAIPPDATRRESLRIGFIPFVRRGEARARDGVMRFELRYTPWIRRGFLRRTWTTDPKIRVASDSFELITPGFER